MPPSIETIDNLPKVPPRDRVNKTDPSKEEQDQEAFKKALKRRMEQRDDDGDDERQDAPLILELDLSKARRRASRGSTGAPRGDTDNENTSGTTPAGQDESEPPPDHIDLKA